MKEKAEKYMFGAFPESQIIWIFWFWRIWKLTTLVVLDALEGSLDDLQPMPQKGINVK